MTTDYIVARLGEFRTLGPGWYDGENPPFDPAGLDWLASAILSYCNPLIPQPMVYPTADGAVAFEWRIGDWNPSLEIDLKARTGYWHNFNHATKTEADANLNMDAPPAWQQLRAELGKLATPAPRRTEAPK